MFTKLHLLMGFVSLIVAVSVGWFVGSFALGVIIAVLAAIVIFYLAWERHTLGEDAGQRENNDEPGSVPHSGISVHRGDGGGF
jgi:FtsH-binding integral membrane protein